MNFFDQACQEPPFNDASRGICDPQNGTRAYTDTANPQHWVARIKNDNQVNLIFTAVDQCVILNGQEPNRGRCDGMLHSNEHLYLIELKDQASSWRTHAIEQLESTIQFILQYHATQVQTFRHKKAFACNRAHPAFQVLDTDISLRFFRTYGFRIDVQADVLIV